MIAGDSGDVGGVLISVVINREHGISLPCLLYQMLSGLCVIPVVLPPPPSLCGLEIFPYTVCGGELAHVLVSKWLLVLSSGTMLSSGKQG